MRYVFIGAAGIAVVVIVLLVQNQNNYDLYEHWVGGEVTSPVTKVILIKGSRRAICTDPAFLKAADANCPFGKPSTQPTQQFHRYDSAVIELSDGRTIECDGGAFGMEGLSFELEDRSTGCELSGLDQAMLDQMRHFLFDSDGGSRSEKVFGGGASRP